MYKTVNFYFSSSFREPADEAHAQSKISEEISFGKAVRGKNPGGGRAAWITWAVVGTSSPSPATPARKTSPACYKFPTKSSLSCYLCSPQKLERSLLKACCAICASHSLLHLFLPLSQNRAHVCVKTGSLFQRGAGLGRSERSWNCTALVQRTGCVFVFERFQAETN